VSNRVANTISKIDMVSSQVVANYPAPGGPDCMDVSADGRYIFVASRWARKLSVIDTVEKKVVNQVNVGKSPHGVWTLSHARAKVLVPAASKRQGWLGLRVDHLKEGGCKDVVSCSARWSAACLPFQPLLPKLQKDGFRRLLQGGLPDLRHRAYGHSPAGRPGSAKAQGTRHILCGQ
jgi:YVTN family beta-propeller protein